MAKTHLESPSHYLHTKCKLQKDKGKGERLESAISARGRESTLEKLRDKMKLIVEVSGELQASVLSSNNDLASMANPSGNSITSNSGTGTGTSTSARTSSFAMSAGMKRRRAKIASIEQNTSCSSGGEDGSYIIETRSMIELQLGFLSMQYGLLLRWDAYRTGKIDFVCLRKMCHDSFYTKIRSPPTISNSATGTGTGTGADTTSTIINTCINTCREGQSSQYKYPKSIMKHKSQQSLKERSTVGPPRIIAATKKREVTPPLVVRSPKGANHAIYQRSSGATEVVLVDAPYRVPHPDVFAPSVLSLDVHRLTGLDPKSQWTLIMTFDGHTEIAHLKYNHRERVFETTRTAPCKWEMTMMPDTHRPTSTVISFDVATGLEIRLFEQRPKQNQHLRRVASGVVGMVGGRSSSSSTYNNKYSSSYVPPGSDPFSLSSPSNSYVIQNQRLIYYTGNNNNNNNHNGRGRISRSNSNSENSVGSSNSGASGSTGGGSGMGRNSSSKKSTSRLTSTMTVPLGGLVSQPSTSQTTLWKLTIPFTHDEDAEVTLTLMHQSDYAHWLYKELRARRKEEKELALSSAASSLTGVVAGINSGTPSDLWRRLVSSSRNSNSNNNGNDDNGENYDDDTYTDDSDDTEVYFMEWLYYCCFDPR